MKKLYGYRTADQVSLRADGSPIRGACAGAVCLWLRERVHGQPLMVPPDLATAAALQQMFTDMAHLRHQQVDASISITYKLHAIGLQTNEEFGTKKIVDLCGHVRHKPGLYYLSVSFLRRGVRGLHAIGLQIQQNKGYYLFNPDEGLLELSFGELVDYLVLHYGSEGQFIAIRLCGNEGQFAAAGSS